MLKFGSEYSAVKQNVKFLNFVVAGLRRRNSPKTERLNLLSRIGAGGRECQLSTGLSWACDMPKIFDFGPKSLRLVSAENLVSDLVKSIKYVGLSRPVEPCDDLVPPYDEGAIIPEFSANAPCRNWLRQSPDSLSRTTFWACKLDLGSYVRILYELGILLPSEIINVERNSRIGAWARELLVPFFVDIVGEDSESVQRALEQIQNALRSHPVAEFVMAESIVDSPIF